MLQIMQGMYFREVPLTDTVHRGIYYTNLRVYRDQSLSFVFGRLLPSTTFQGLRTLTVEAKERLETLTLNGQQEVLAATTGDQLLDEIAAVIAFCLNVTCVRDYDMARRLIATDDDTKMTRRGPTSLLRQTFDAAVVLADAAVADLDQFVQALVALERKSYEAAIRALRQVTDATLLVDEDPALAYTLIVAALESLSQAIELPAATWEEYDEPKRRRIDAAVEKLDSAARDQVRAAVLANEHHGLQRRFVAFVLNHVEPSFYRAEAVGAIRPIKATDLPNALRQAYAIRSRNVHMLKGLAREVWMAGDRSDTTLLDTGMVLSLEGLTRLSRHIVRRFVERAPTGVDSTFNYRLALPDIMRGHWAAQYWIGNANGFSCDSAPAYLNGMLELLIEGITKRSNAGLVDMTAVLEQIESTALGLSKLEDRLAMAGIMTLWNYFAPKEFRRTLKPKLVQRFDADIAKPSMVSFALLMVLDRPVTWLTDDLEVMASRRRKDRLGRKPAPMPTRIDAAIHVVLADRLLRDANKDKAMEHLGHAVETLPGLVDLINFEKAFGRGDHPILDLRRFVFGETEFVDWRKPGDDGNASADAEGIINPA